MVLPVDLLGSASSVFVALWRGCRGRLLLESVGDAVAVEIGGDQLGLLGVERVGRGDSFFVDGLAAHGEADSDLGHGVVGELVDDVAAMDDEQPVGQAHDLVEVGGDEQYGRATITRADQGAVDELHGADVDAARRLRDDQQRRVGLELARDDDLLHVAAGQRPDRGRRCGTTDVVGLDEA